MQRVFRSPVPPARGLRIWALLLTALLSFGIRESAAHVHITLVPQAPVAGGDVLLSVSLHGPFQSLTWYRAPGHATFPVNVILIYKLETLKKPTIGPTNTSSFGPLNKTNIRPIDKPNYGPIYEPDQGTIHKPNYGPIYKPDKVTIQKPNHGPIKNASPGPKHTGRELMLQNGSLRITNLRPSDVGDYTVKMMTPAGPVQSSMRLMLFDKRPSKSTSRPRLDRTISPSALHTREKGVLAGAVVGAVIGTALLTTAVILLYNKRRKSLKRRRNQPLPPPRRDLKLPNHRPSVGTDGYVDPSEIHAPLRQYESMPAYPPKDQASPTQEEEHVYTELEYMDENVYNDLHV
ncbi:uncharacterized protein LOC144766565 isoform X2 [Lissotriton helveticus]